MGAPRLRKIRAWYTIYPVSVEALEAIPALEILDYMHDPRQPAPFSELETVCSALKRGMALQHLRQLYLTSFRLGVTGWRSLLAALAGAACAPLLDAADTFPRSRVETIGDAGVASLALGLLRAPRTRLRELLVWAMGVWRLLRVWFTKRALRS